MAAKTAKKTFESQLRRLEEIAGMLDEGNIPLERTLELYEEGVALAKACAETLARAEQQIQTLSKSAAGLFTLRDMDTDDEE